MKITTHSSTADEFTPYKSTWDDQLKDVWSLPIEQIQLLSRSVPPALPENAPVLETDVEISHRMIPVRDGTKIELRLYESAKVQRNDQSVLFLRIHGGGWISYSHDLEDPENRFIATIPNILIVSVDYRLAPQFKFPTGLNDCFDALQWCKDNAEDLGINPEKIIIGGSSSGGNMTAALALKAQSPGSEVSGIIGQVLNFPATCHPQHYPKDKYKLDSMVEHANEPLTTADNMRFFWEQYTDSSEDGANFLASPLLAPKKLLSKAPRAFIVACGADPVRDEGIAYGEALDSAGVDVQLDMYPGLPHGFVVEARLKSGGVYYERVIEFVKSVVAEPDPRKKQSQNSFGSRLEELFKSWILCCVSPQWTVKAKSSSAGSSYTEKASSYTSGSS